MKELTLLLAVIAAKEADVNHLSPTIMSKLMFKWFKLSLTVKYRAYWARGSKPSSIAIGCPIIFARKRRIGSRFG